MNAVDMSAFIAPKSDQLNADDLIGGPRTITVTRVTGNEGNAEQPVNVYFEGDDGKPFRPCKSMRRVMVKIWGADASKYAGRSMTIWRDPKVKWGGMEVGGIRISHMTGIEKPEQMALTESRANRKPYTVQPLQVEQQADALASAIEKIIANIAKAPNAEKLDAYLAGKPAGAIADARANRQDLANQLDIAIANKRAEWSDDDDPFAEDPEIEDAETEETQEEASSPDSEDDKPAWHEAVEIIRQMIAQAKTKDALDAADAEFVKHSAALPDDVQKEIDAAIAKKRRELAK